MRLRVSPAFVGPHRGNERRYKPSNGAWCGKQVRRRHESERDLVFFRTASADGVNVCRLPVFVLPGRRQTSGVCDQALAMPCPRYTWRQDKHPINRTHPCSKRRLVLV